MKKSAFIVLAVFLFAFISIAKEKTPNGWLTKFEKSNYLETPRYDETIAYFKKFEKASPYAKMIKIGVSPQGRDIYCLIASKDKCFTAAQAKKSGKPVVMVNNGIHSGEIEGKDACMLLLREILVTKEKAALLDKAILMVIPVFSVDGHERFGRFNRINQNGPVEMGWRTTAQNLNLNRDFLKADAPEMQAFLKLYSAWLPDFFIDSHTTNGADYQYTVTYEIERSENLYQPTAQFINKSFIPFIISKVEKEGFLTAPYINFWDEDIKKGIILRPTPPRFSHGYTAAQNRPGLLIETHMMKPYKDRVFATKSMIEATLEFVNKNSAELVSLNKAADVQVPLMYSVNKKPFPIMLNRTDEAEKIIFKGNKWIEDTSEISGGKRITYTKEKYDFEMPIYYKSKPVDSVIAPYAYLIPKEWSEIVERLKLHGVVVEELKKETRFDVERYKFTDPKFQEKPYEGHQQVNSPYNVFTEKVTAPAGTYVIKTNQRAIRVILHALEPKGYDAFLRWGFFNTIFEVKEYFEDYVMEREALKMIQENPILKEEFDKKLSQDKDFKSNPHRRLAWFYEKSPFFDKNLNLYPVMRLVNETAIK